MGIIAGRLSLGLICLLIGATEMLAHQAGQPPPGRVAATITALEGKVHLPAVSVELRNAERTMLIAQTVTDGAGQVVFPDVPPGRYLISASRPGFIDLDSAIFTVRSGDTAQVLLDMRLAFAPVDVEVRADAPAPTNSVQPVSMSDMLSGRLFETAPLAGDDFRSLLPLLPGVVRGPDGRLRLRGGQPTQGALQISSATLVDPSTGDWDLDLPVQSLESVEVLANPFAAEYGRFTTSITQLRTRAGTNDWEVSTGNLVPRFRGVFSGIRAFEPRLSVRGPIRKDRVFFAQDMQFRYVTIPVKSLPGEPESDLRSFDSHTRIDGVLSPRHLLSGALIMFPRESRRMTMNTFRPVDTSVDFDQTGWAAGLVDRFALSPNLVLESTVSVRRFEIDVNASNLEPMVYTPETQRGGFFNDQERDVTSLQWVQSLSYSLDLWRGQHVFKAGTDLQRSKYNGESISRPVEIRRLDGSLAERIDFGPGSLQSVNGTELALFAQDRWRVNSRLTFEFGLRADRDGVVEGVNWSPRAGAAVSVLPDGRGILRGGIGKFSQRTPLNVDAFSSFEPRRVTRFDAGGGLLGIPVTLANHVDGPLRTPEAVVGNLEWDQRFGRRVLVKLAGLARRLTHDFIVTPDHAAGLLRLSSTGSSSYREVEATVRYMSGPRHDLTLSYVWSHATTDLNTYDEFYGNFRNPIIRPNERSLSPTDVPHRLLLKGIIGLPWRWDLSPVVELRSGFPWSAVDEFQDFVGPRNRTARLPVVKTLDFTLVRPWRISKYRFRAGLRVNNALGDTAERDIQANVASPFYGTAYNPVERSIGFVINTGR